MMLGGAAGTAEIEISVEGLRNGNGSVRLCLTRNAAHFPDCNRDPAAIRRSLPAGQAANIRFSGAAPGVYALALIHDENDNGRLDKFMAIPREGFAFSRNPGLRMGPPSFEEVRFDAPAGRVRQTVRVRYLL
ncbi:DUF2141 domain-containing protein [Sphingosinicella terrae]|uniref:DUF2141 domain-containing protein n=1 Tax=Sphingosinicella terrae TaxID=2172047 RepID=UPI000E0D0B6A|nr:DUF2141 domain-containing protein [Sphingosinicella terrae]